MARVALMMLLELALLFPSFFMDKSYAQPSHQARPIPAGENAYTYREFNAALLKHYRRTLVEAYQRVGKTDPKWDEAAKRFLEGSALHFAQAAGAASPAGLLRDGESLLAAGCSDPAVLYFHGKMLQMWGRSEESERVLSRAVQGMAESKYTKSCWADAAVALAKVCQDLGSSKAEEFERYCGLAIKWLAEAVSEGAYAPGEQRICLDTLDQHRKGVFAGRGAKIYEAFNKAKMEPYIKRVVAGRYHLDKAWEARGADWAYKVTPEGSAGFGKHLAQARNLLTSAWKLHPEFPEAPCDMIRVAIGGGAGAGETPRTWFDRTVTAQTDYALAYDRLLTALRPRWGGSYEEMYKFGTECLETKRFDTGVPWFFFVVLGWIREDMAGDKHYWLLPDTYRLLNVLFDGYLKEAKDDRNRRLYKSYQALSAWYCERYDDAVRLSKELDFELGGYAPPSFPGSGQVTFELRALAAPVGPRIRHADALHKEGRLAESLAIFEELLRGPALEYETELIVRARAATVRAEEAFARGDWTSLLTRDTCSDLSRAHFNGGWEDDRSANITIKDPSPWFDCRADFGNRFEIRGELEFVSALPTPDAGLCMYLAQAPTLGTDRILVVIYPNPGRIAVYNWSREFQVVWARVEVKGKNTFRLQLWDKVLNVYWNGRLVHDRVVVDRYLLPPTGTIGSGVTEEGVGLVFKARNWEIRRLSEAPSPSRSGTSGSGASGGGTLSGSRAASSPARPEAQQR
jgi:hypothetical protein